MSVALISCYALPIPHLSHFLCLFLYFPTNFTSLHFSSLFISLNVNAFFLISYHLGETKTSPSPFLSIPHFLPSFILSILHLLLSYIHTSSVYLFITHTLSSFPTPYSSNNLIIMHILLATVNNFLHMLLRLRSSWAELCYSLISALSPHLHLHIS